MHTVAIGLEAALLFGLIDARAALMCFEWCATGRGAHLPLVASVLPATFWRPAFHPVMEPGATCLSPDVEGLVVFAGAALAAHALYVVTAGRRSVRP
jgi:hypothetical protein